MRKDHIQLMKIKHGAPSCSRLRVCADAHKDISDSRCMQAGLDLITCKDGETEIQSRMDIYMGKVRVDAS